MTDQTSLVPVPEEPKEQKRSSSRSRSGASSRRSDNTPVSNKGGLLNVVLMNLPRGTFVRTDGGTWGFVKSYKNEKRHVELVNLQLRVVTDDTRSLSVVRFDELPPHILTAFKETAPRLGDIDFTYTPATVVRKHEGDRQVGLLVWSNGRQLTVHPRGSEQTSHWSLEEAHVTPIATLSGDDLTWSLERRKGYGFQPNLP